MKRERDVAVLAVVLDALDQQFQHEGLFTRHKCSPQVVEVGQRLAYLGIIDEFTIERDQLVVDFGQAAFGAANTLLGFRQVGVCFDTTASRDARKQPQSMAGIAARVR